MSIKNLKYDLLKNYIKHINDKLKDIKNPKEDEKLKDIAYKTAQLLYRN